MEITLDKAFSDVPKDHGVMAVMGKEGDTKYVWNKREPKEVKEAEDQFKKMKTSGFAVFKVDKNGGKAEQVHEFSKDEEAYIFVPPLVGG